MSDSTVFSSSRCGATKLAASGGAVSLPVLSAVHGSPHGPVHKLKKSKTGPIRAAVLIGVHVIIAAHIALWFIRGSTVSPVEPSESMQTLELGIVNAGFVFFALAIVSTLVLGRFFCGWGCHIVALQDLCGWIMKKMGVRPRPFRSRLLLWVPLGMALYMFVWPTFRREVLVPLIGDEAGRLPLWMGQAAPFHGLHTEFIVKDFWATFPPWFVAIPFFLVVGFGAVYFLGNKGFCTYGCPYGGFFGPADLVAVGKIRVTDACEGCGHCTATCSSNVRVHEEVRDFGMVVNPGCMKCMDCISVCPNDALYFGFGKPTVLARPRDDAARERVLAKKRSPKHYDLTLAEELAAAGVFLLMLVSFRGFLNEVPLLMAVGMAGIGAFGTWKLWSMARVANVRVQSLQLKIKGRWTRTGLLLALGAGAYLVLAGWSGAVKYHIWQGGLRYSEMTLPIEASFQPGYEVSEAKLRERIGALRAGGGAAPDTAEQIRAIEQHIGELATARRAIDHYIAAGPAWGDEGGIGWFYSDESLARLSYLLAIVGDYTRSETFLRRLLARQEPNDALITSLGQLMRLSGAPADLVITELRAHLQPHAEFHAARQQLASLLVETGRAPEALAEYEAAMQRLPASGEVRRDAAFLVYNLGQPERAIALLEEAVKVDASDLQVLLSTASAFVQAGLADRAVTILQDAAKLAPDSAVVHHSLASAFAVTGRAGDAAASMRRAAELDKKSPVLALQLAQLLGEMGRHEEAAKWAEEAARRAERAGGHH